MRQDVPRGYLVDPRVVTGVVIPGQIFVQRSVKVELSLIDQLEYGKCEHRLGQRRSLEHRLFRNYFFGRRILNAESPVPRQLGVANYSNRESGHITPLH
jgi:hypothetical protein